MIIEVCVDSVQSAVNAVNGGANRLELCGNLGLGGGTTPTLGLLKSVQRAVSNKASIMVMIRPRTGNFFYTEEEIDVMLDDIEVFKAHGVHGIVIGALTPEGKVDTERAKRLVDAAQPLEVCFHRAFDMTKDAVEALRDIKSIKGITRVLTSGQGKTVVDGLPLLKSALSVAKGSDKLTILPGSGINGQTIHQILDVLLPFGLEEVHLSGGTWIDGGMVFKRENLGFGLGEIGEWGVWVTLEENIRQVREIVDARCTSNSF